MWYTVHCSVEWYIAPSVDCYFVASVDPSLRRSVPRSARRFIGRCVVPSVGTLFLRRYIFRRSVHHSVGRYIIPSVGTSSRRSVYHTVGRSFGTSLRRSVHGSVDRIVHGHEEGNGSTSALLGEDLRGGGEETSHINAHHSIVNLNAPVAVQCRCTNQSAAFVALVVTASKRNPVFVYPFASFLC